MSKTDLRLSFTDHAGNTGEPATWEGGNRSGVASSPLFWRHCPERQCRDVQTLLDSKNPPFAGDFLS
ncbi:MAG: hypothetical protein WBV90_21185 [Terrimicrobiaceae bacterium]